MPRKHAGARRRVLPYVLAPLFGGLAAPLGWYASLYASQAKTIDWLIAGLLCGALFACTALAIVVPMISQSPHRSEKETAGLESGRKRMPTAQASVTSTLVPQRPRHLREWPRRGRAPRQLPERLGRFRGRVIPLRALTEAYVADRGHSMRLLALLAVMPAWPRGGRRFSRSHPERPTIILIHGMQGVGKTALAQRFAHSIARHFPDGQLYANLGIGRERRTPTDVLQDFLKALGVTDAEMPAGEAARAHLFRSLTVRKRMLVVLDAARGYDQIGLVLPSGSRCAVIITSRLRLGSELGGFQYLLEAPDTSEADDIFRTYAGLAAHQDIDEVTEVINYCGALPLALRSTGEQIGNDLDVATLATRLVPLATRLAALRFRGRDIGERIMADYDRLPPTEQRAFRLLSLLESPTFGPWVLAPLMNVSTSEAESLAASLARWHLLRDAGSAVGTGLSRYSLHPLVRLVAKQLLDQEMTPADQAAARKDLDAEYLAAARIVLVHLEPELGNGAPTGPASAWAQCQNAWLPGVLQNMQHWVRTEYRNILRAMAYAEETGESYLCWRIAAHIGSCVADGLDTSNSIGAFETAASVAKRESAHRGRGEVLLAFGSFLAAVENYRESFSVLDQVIALADSAGDTDLSRREKHWLRASAHRRKAEAWEQMGAYKRAADELQRARTEAQPEDPAQIELSGKLDGELGHIELLIAENATWLRPEKWLSRDAFDKASISSDEGAQFRAALDLAEHARRRRDWDQAHDFMRKARDDNYEDARRTAALRYRTARLLLQKCRESSPRKRPAIACAAAGQASAAALLFRNMDNGAGLIRAKTLMARALLSGGYAGEAHDMAQYAEKALAALGEGHPAYESLRARVQRCLAEIDLAFGHPEQACARFKRAITDFEQDGNWRSVADTWLTYAVALMGAGRLGIALARLHEAEEYYVACRDVQALADARRARFKITRKERWQRWFNGSLGPGPDA
jgi:tetratricopeptide (TPR) repeat protein